MTSQSSSTGVFPLFKRLRREAFSPLQRALTALGRGDLDGCLGHLQQGKRDGGPTDPWQDTDRRHLQTALVQRRDGGDLEGAAEGLRLARAVWPRDTCFATELLIIYQHRAVGTPEKVGELIAGLPEATKLTHLDLLFVAFLLGRDGDAVGAQMALRRLKGSQDESLRAFPDQFSDAVRAAFVSGPDMGGQPFEPRLVLEGLSILFLYFDRLGGLHTVVRQVAMLDSFGLEHSAYRAIAALQSVESLLSVDGQSTLIAILTAFDRYPEARVLIDKLLENEDSRSSVLFAKSTVSHAMRTRAYALERHALGRFLDQDSTLQDGLHRARRREILDRRAVTGAAKPLNIFIGFFGQTRASEQVIPGTINMLDRDFSNGMGGPFNLHYGFSTWRKSGSRVFHRADPAVFFLQVVPPEVQPLMSALFGASGDELARHWSATIETTISFMNSKADDPVSEETLREFLPDYVSVVIDDELDVEQELKSALATAGKGPGIPNLNQYKMWSRISALKLALHEQETRSGQKMDACLLMRCDMGYMSGKPSNLLCRAAAEMERLSVFCDHDPHAEYIEGAGDRYLAFSRTAAEVMFSGYEYFLGATHERDQSSDVLERTRGHEGLHSLLFSHGLTPKPVTSIAAHLHRGRVPAEILMPALRQDAARTSHPDHRALIDQVLLDLAATA